MNISAWAALLTALVIFLALGSMMGIAIWSTQDAVDQNKHAQLEAISRTLVANIQRTAQFALNTAEVIARQPGVPAALAKGDRKALFALQKESFDWLRTEAGVKLITFQDKELKTFLQMQDPFHFGEDISKSRPMVVAVQKNKRGLKGTKMTEYGLGIRGVAPILWNDQLVGSLEVSFEMRDLLTTVKVTTDAEVAVAINQNETNQAGNSESSVTLRLEDSTDGHLFRPLLASGLIHLSRTPTFLDYPLEGERYGIVVQPLLNYGGDLIGCLIAAKNFTLLDTLPHRNIAILGAIALGASIIAFSLYMILIRAFLLRPLDALVRTTEARVQGRTLASGVVMGGAAEIERLATMIDQIAVGGDKNV